MAMDQDMGDVAPALQLGTEIEDGLDVRFAGCKRPGRLEQEIVEAKGAAAMGREAHEGLGLGRRRIDDGQHVADPRLAEERELRNAANRDVVANQAADHALRVMGLQVTGLRATGLRLTGAGCRPNYAPRKRT